MSYLDGQAGHKAGVTVSIDGQANDGGDANTSDTSPGVQAEGDNVKTDVENVVGAEGNDTFAGSAAKNHFVGGEGTDTVSFADRTDSITASLASGLGGPEGDTWTGIENLTGGSGDDVLIGSGAGETIAGGPGHDVLRGGGGNDTLRGNEGSNTADYSQDGRTVGVDVDLNAGTAFPIGGTAEDSLFDIQNAIGTEHSDRLAGGLTANTLIGLAGDDTLTGRQGDDILDPGAGTDFVAGSQGSDTVSYAGRTADVSVTLEGTANDGEAGEKDNVNTTVENVIGGSGNDVITADANPGLTDKVNSFFGGAGNDTLTGLDGDDTLDGGPGSDTVNGGAGNDTLRLVDATADLGLCGPGDKDTADADDIDVLSDCETVKRTASPTPPTGGGGGGGGGGAGGGPAPAASTIDVSTARVREGNSGTSTLTFTISLSAAQPAPVAVPVQTADGTANAPVDYIAGAGTLTFAPGETSKTVPVTVNGDKRREPAETMRLVLGAPAGNAKVAAPGIGIGTIVNDDKAKRKPKPRVTAAAKPTADTTAPFAFGVSGKVVRPKGVSMARGCKGRVRVIVKAGRKTVAKGFDFVNRSCAYAAMLRVDEADVPANGRLRIVAQFRGNEALRGASSRPVRVSAG